MPKRIVKQPVMVQREGKLVYPTVGKEFDFTGEEVTSLNKLQPKALGLIVVNDPPKVEAAAAPVKRSTPEAKVAN